MVTDISANKKLLGIFGGTFDPVHLGHLLAVNEMQKEVKFSRIHWVLSARPPHKDETSATIEQRFKMLELALEGYPSFVADDIEISRPEVSWTIDTVIEFSSRYPEHWPCLIIGADSLEKLSTWDRYEELIQLAHFVVMARPGYSSFIPPEMNAGVVKSAEELRHAASASVLFITHTDHSISATKIRKLIAREGTKTSKLKPLLPGAVLDYINHNQTYTFTTMQPEEVKNHVVEALEDTKGQDMRVLEIADISDFADYMVVVSGTSDTHVKALAREASDRLRSLNVKPLNEDGQDLGEWVLVDFGDVVLHVMRPEVREYYDLEKLWDEDVRELVKQHRAELEA